MADIKLGYGCGIKATLLMPTGVVCDLRDALFVNAVLVLPNGSTMYAKDISADNVTNAIYVRLLADRELTTEGNYSILFNVKLVDGVMYSTVAVNFANVTTNADAGYKEIVLSSNLEVTDNPHNVQRTGASPKVSPRQTWLVYNDEAKAYEDTGIPAEVNFSDYYTKEETDEKVARLESEIGVFFNILSITDDNAGFLKIGKTFNAGEKIIVKLLEVEPTIKVSVVLTYNNNSVQSLGNLTKMGDFITATCDSQVNGIYFSATENITAQLYVANYGANQKIENVDETVKEVYNDNKLQEVAIGTLEGWDSMPKYAGQLGSTSVNKTDISHSYNKILKIAPNDKVLIKANAGGAALIAILKSIDFANLAQLDFASGYDGRISIKASTSSKFTMPEDATYIIIACLWAGQERTPSDIQINGKSIIYKEEYITEKKLSAIYLGTEKHHILQSIEWVNGAISSDGTENEAATNIKTDYIDVSGIDLLRLDMLKDGELFCSIGLYDNEKSFITRLTTRVSAQFQFNGNLKDYPNCRFVKISANTTDVSLLTISVDTLLSRFYSRRFLGNKNVKSFSHAGSSLTSGVTAGNNLPSSMWGTYLNGFDVIHCNVRYTTDNVGYCLHDATFVDEVSGNTIALGDVSSEVIEACRIKGQPIAKVESVVYLAKMMGLGVCLYNVYGRLDNAVIEDIVRIAKTYGMFEHIYFGIPNSVEGLLYLDAIYTIYPKSKILLTQSSIPTIDYAQITEVLSRAQNVLSTRQDLEVYIWINSGYDIADYERLNVEKPYNIKVGCYQVTKEQEPVVLPYVDIYTSADGLRSFGIARRDIEVAVTDKYPEFLMGDYGNIV